MKHWWWKILAVVLVLGASIAALRAPLKPALVHVSPDRIAPGRVTLEVTGYNTRFGQEEQAWLENDGQKVCPAIIVMVNDHLMKLTFDVPAGLRNNLTDVHVGRLRMNGALYTEGLGSGIAEQRGCGVGGKYLDFSFGFPNRNILYETIRNLCLHVPMWFTMMVLFGISLVASIRALGSTDLRHDMAADLSVRVGLVFCSMGLITGSIWARATWGAWWTNDVKLNGAAVSALIYLAYLVLRGSVPEPSKRARLAAIYNIFAFVLLVLFIWILPRLNAVDSLHPGNGGNPAFGSYDLDDSLRVVFYPACLGWILIGVWMYTLRLRLARLQTQLDDANPA
jgi:heme exporter protein C